MSGEQCTKVAISAPDLAAGACSQYVSKLEVFDCFTGASLMSGKLALDYTRTWKETTPGSFAPTQVWRFAAKVDMRSPASAPGECPTPKCAQIPGSSAFYYGYVDYALNCATGVFDTVIVLYHGCDDFIHKPGFSSVPGAFHPKKTFALVAPDSSTAPFTPGNASPPSGKLFNEAMRNVTPSPFLGCKAEEQIKEGAFEPQFAMCFCPVSLVPAQQTPVPMKAVGVCGGEFRTLNIYPNTPWADLVVTSIGNWGGTAYPGEEYASVAEGLLLYTDSCGSTASPQSYDVFYGGLTMKGNAVSSVSPSPTPAPLTETFLDLASNYSALVGLPVPFPLFGRVGPTDHLIYVNVTQ